MKGLNEYIIPLKGLNNGIHEFEYVIASEFFEHFEASIISEGELKVKVILKKSTLTNEFDFEINGIVNHECDRCLEIVHQPIEYRGLLIVKYGTEFKELDDEVVIIPEESGEFDISEYIYQFICISIPLRVLHEEGFCDPDMLRKLASHGVQESTDSRWDELKKLLNNN